MYCMSDKEEKPGHQHEFFNLYYRDVYIPAFVRDLILFGQSNVVEVCKTYEINAAQFKEIMETPAFKKEMRETRALIESSPNALIQLKARAIAEMAMDNLAEIIQYGERDSDRIAASKLIAQIAQVPIGIGGIGGASEADNGKPTASGLVLNVNFGKGGVLVPPLPAHGAPLRQVQEVIDVQTIGG